MTLSQVTDGKIDKAGYIIEPRSAVVGKQEVSEFEDRYRGVKFVLADTQASGDAAAFPTEFYSDANSYLFSAISFDSGLLKIVMDDGSTHTYVLKTDADGKG